MAACPEYVEGPLVLSVHFNVSEVKKCSPHLGYRLAKRPTLQAATHPTGPTSPKPETFDGLSNPKSPQCLAIPESLEAKSKGKRKSPVSYLPEVGSTRNSPNSRPRRQSCWASNELLIRSM